MKTVVLKNECYKTINLIYFLISITNEYFLEDEWKVRYYTQVEVNEQLERQRDWLMERVEAARNQSQEGQ